ncbi:MAG: hypothetical protein HY360_17875 [Verrucomicrobia bacterium]|nr:hypothetical protein [Verrucomicrobiota bacterium]
MKTVDMSPDAVTRRLQQVDELRDACLALAGPRLKRPWGVPSSPAVLSVVKEQPARYSPRQNKTRRNL